MPQALRNLAFHSECVNAIISTGAVGVITGVLHAAKVGSAIGALQVLLPDVYQQNLRILLNVCERKLQHLVHTNMPIKKQRCKQ